MFVPVEKFAQRNDLDIAITAEIEHCLVTRYDNVRFAGPCTFEDTIVLYIGKDADSPPWTDDLCQVCQEYGHARQFIGVARKLVGQHDQKLVDDCLGNDQNVFAVDNTPKRDVCAASRQH